MTEDVRHSGKLAWTEYKETIDINMDDGTFMHSMDHLERKYKCFEGRSEERTKRRNAEGEDPKSILYIQGYTLQFFNYFFFFLLKVTLLGWEVVGVGGRS